MTIQDIINEAIGYIQIYISALIMPLDKLEETEKILGQKLNILENMSKEVIYLIDQRTDDLMKSIREAFNNEQQLLLIMLLKLLSRHIMKIPS